VVIQKSPVIDVLAVQQFITVLQLGQTVPVSCRGDRRTPSPLLQRFAVKTFQDFRDMLSIRNYDDFFNFESVKPYAHGRQKKVISNDLV
jgi:hypothetical protein